MKKVNVAIIPADGFGDGLVQLVIAHNLQRLDYQVTYYNGYAKALKNGIDGFELKNTLPFNCEIAELEQYPVVLYDAHSKFARGAEPKIKAWLQEYAIPYVMSGSKMEHPAPNIAKLKARLGQENEHLAEFFVKFYKRPRLPRFLPPRLPVVQQVKRFFQFTLGFASATDSTGVNTRFYRHAEVNNKRVVIHPTSSSVDKNWRKEQYLQFANLLKNEGWEPVFTVAPREREEWLEVVNNQFEVTGFPSIETLAKYYAASYAFVGNDSGNAHLASMLGLPCLVIFKRWRRYPGWRPGWGITKVVLADFPFNLRKKDWQEGVSPEKVLTNFKQMLAKK